MPIRISRRLFAAFIASAACSSAQDLSAKMDEYLNAHVKLQRFMGSVLVANGGAVLLEKGYGMANIELDVPNTPATKFRIGSMTKEFTATAILQLQEQSRLSVSDPVCKYVENCPDAWKAITIHHLLTHTSGIPSYTDDPKFRKPEFMRVPMKPLDIVMLSKDKPLEFQPGEKWKYDNTGYVFLGYIIEKVTGESYADYVKKHIFGPLGMNDTGYDDTKSILRGRAEGYARGAAGYLNAAYLDMTLPHAAGSLYSTVQDMYRWDRSLYTTRMLSRKSLDAMFRPVKNDYGYGLALGPMFNHKQIGHGGGINGFTSMFERFPDDDATVIVLSNVEGGSIVARGLTAILFGEAYSMPGSQE